jgi:hypothetical protein
MILKPNAKLTGPECGAYLCYSNTNEQRILGPRGATC